MTPTTTTETMEFDRVAAVLPQLRASLRRQDVAAAVRLMTADSGLLLLATHALEHANAAELAIPPTAILTLRRAIARVSLGLATSLPCGGAAHQG